MKKFAMVFVFLALTACGGGGEESFENINDASNATAETVSKDLHVTNLSSGFPWGEIANGLLKRWPVEDNLIPVKLNDSSEAIHALDTIEKTIGKSIFDRISIADIPDQDITRGLIVSMGTAVDPFSKESSIACGVVSSEAGSAYISGPIIDESGVIDAKLYVNIGSSGCTSNLNDIAIHEFGHAIGLGGHFQGFGIGPIIDGEFWNVLKTIYQNPTGSTIDEINVFTKVKINDSTSGTLSSAVVSDEYITRYDYLENSYMDYCGICHDAEFSSEVGNTFVGEITSTDETSIRTALSTIPEMTEINVYITDLIIMNITEYLNFNK